jgi:hypothetical protein
MLAFLLVTIAGSSLPGGFVPLARIPRGRFQTADVDGHIYGAGHGSVRVLGLQNEGFGRADLDGF